MKLGIGSYAFAWAIGVPGYAPRKPMSAIELMNITYELGGEVVQFCDNLPLDSLSDEDFQYLVRAAQSKGITLEYGIRGSSPLHIQKSLEFAQRIGSSILRMVPDDEFDHPSPGELVRRLKPLVVAFERSKVTLAMENHDRFATTDILDILNALETEWVGVCLDTVNSFGALETPERVAEVLAPHCLSLHVKDFNIRRMDHRMGFYIEGAIAGSGKLDIPSLLARIQSVGHDPNAILEQWTPWCETLDKTIALERDWAQKSVEYLRRLFY